jgi:hypothetical protein
MTGQLFRRLEGQPYKAPPIDQTSLEAVFEEEPVSLDVFIGDKKYMNNPPLSPVQFDAVRHIEQIYFKETYELLQELNPYWKPVRFINYATLQWGKGAGKDHIARVSALRIAYLLQCLKSPQDYFSMPPQDTIHMLNVASSRTQAQSAFFTPMTKVAKTSWFKDKCHPTKDTIVWDKNIEMVSGSADSESQEGLNLILGVADEIDAFRSREEILSYRAKQMREPTKSAEAIMKMLKTSAKTRFVHSHKIVAISYPRFLGSYIQKLTKQGEKDIAKKSTESKHYVSGPLATWDVNPRVESKKAFSDDYAEDPVTARSMYECAPARAVNPYFRNEDAVDSCFTDIDPEEPQILPLSVNYELESVQQGQHAASVWRPFYTFDPSLVPIQGARYVLHADLAVRGDRAGVALAHVVSYDSVPEYGEDEIGGEVETWFEKPHVKIDFCISFEADLKLQPEREIQIRWVRQLAVELRRRAFNLELVTYDAFQSTDSMQILLAQGIETKRQSADLSDVVWKNMRDLMYEGRIKMPRTAYLKNELLSLVQLTNGKIDHPPGGSKDEADAVGCAALAAVMLGGREADSGEQAYLGQNQIYSMADTGVFLPTAMRGMSVRNDWVVSPQT